MSERLTVEVLDGLERLETEATPGPSASVHDGRMALNVTGTTRLGRTVVVAKDLRAEDAEYLAALRNSAPALIAAARERDSLRAQLAAEREGLQRERSAVGASFAKVVAERDRLAAALTDMCGAFVPTDHPVLIEALALLLTPPAPDRPEAEDDPPCRNAECARPHTTTGYHYSERDGGSTS